MATSSPSPATVNRSAATNTATATIATIHSTSYWPRMAEVKLPANQMPMLCSRSVASAR